MLLASAAAAQDAPEGAGGEVVVTAVRLEQTAERLAECIARRCPPAEDVAASLAHVENQFVAGAYRDAQRTVAEAIRRNRGFANTNPVDVAVLYRADARINAHLGDGDGMKQAMRGMLASLRAGLPEEDPQTLYGRIEMADGLSELGNIRGAEREYKAIAEDAVAAGQPTIRNFALLRTASLKVSLAQLSERFRPEARAALDALKTSSASDASGFRLATQVLETRLAMSGGDPDAIDALIARVKAEPTRTPRLLYGKPVELGAGKWRDPPLQNYEDQWIDVAFWIGPDGRTRDAALLRQSEHYNGGWTKRVLASLASRRYAPLALPPGDPGLLRVERYTITSRLATRLGSRIAKPTGLPRVEVLDLTLDAPQPGMNPQRAS
ncbi:hypothetical protein LK533_01380 [Sphingomonas sp. PL-96]|uniref:hypothetical protein n=1 Tax=Sphingomonas sp. PL-96 TaxID=2887201 RepID=UPI001E508187|nr:hypothetical protein [Sphingomonas sp. PL-96]MCC2975323.1 hypothetical protein [Sphingomonas sp. PL-96]